VVEWVEKGRRDVSVQLAAVVLMPHPNGGWVAFRHAEGWNLPGGKVEAGESPRFAAFRECVEETGVVPTSLRPLTVFRGFHSGVEIESHVFFAPMPGSEPPTTEEGTVLREGATVLQLSSGRFPKSVQKIFEAASHGFVQDILQSDNYRVWRNLTTNLAVRLATQPRYGG
jgi:ADP-ribose pyrophosphatase YjhB (NUDIX family)